MNVQSVAKKQLIVDSQDPTQFCVRMVTEIQHAIDPSFLENLNIHRVRRFFFVNQSWRLTNSGYQAISDHYHAYASSNERNKVITGKVLLNMDNCVGGPWYIRGAHVFVFDPTIHFEIQIVNGILSDFVDFKSTR